MTTANATRLLVSSMSTSHDAVQVRRAIFVLPGVNMVDVDLENRVVCVFHSGSIMIAQLINSLEEAGYRGRRAMPGEGTGTYISSPWGAIRAAGPTPESEMALFRAMAVLGLILLVGMCAARLWLPYKDNRAYVFLVLGTVGQAILGWRLYQQAWKQLIHFRLRTDFLVALASTLLFLKGAHLVLKERQDVPHFLLLVLVMTTLYASRWLVLWIRSASGENQSQLISCAPLKARVRRDGTEMDILACELRRNDEVLVDAGERFAADGVIIEGSSRVDESLFTGQAHLSLKKQGDQVFGGSINGRNPVVFQVKGVAEDTALSEMVRLLEDARTRKPTRALHASRLGRALGPVAVLMAVATFYHEFSFAEAGFDAGVLRGVAVLVTASPWILSLAVPVVMGVALVCASRCGALLLSGSALEVCSSLKCVVLDAGAELFQKDKDDNSLATLLFFCRQHKIKLYVFTDKNAAVSADEKFANGLTGENFIAIASAAERDDKLKELSRTSGPVAFVSISSRLAQPVAADLQVRCTEISGISSGRSDVVLVDSGLNGLFHTLKISRYATFCMRWIMRTGVLFVLLAVPSVVFLIPSPAVSVLVGGCAMVLLAILSTLFASLPAFVMGRLSSVSSREHSDL
jgi:cation transport ATPase